jgi:hypothetical protein
VLYRPLPGQAFDARLFDTGGIEIAKTSYGNKFGREPTPDRSLLAGTYPKDFKDTYGHWRSRSRELISTNAGSSDYYWDFDVGRAFKVPTPGEYQLIVEVRLFAKDTNGVFKPFVLPAVSRMVRFTEQDL